MNSSNLPKVNILLSSYNGEKYIREQIKSLVSQDYSNIEIYIRDDGSGDTTRDILNEYVERPEIHIVFGENVGFIKSFLTLLSSCASADYYAFCDQDDVWLPNKISRAVEKLAETDSSKPVLYFSSYDYYNENLRFLSSAKKPENIGFVNSLVDCAPLGFNSVMNAAARECICQNIPVHSCGHDWWTYMVCAGLGSVIFDDFVSVKYRRCGKNVSNGGEGFLKAQIWRFRKFFLGNYFENITEQLQEYESLYSANLNQKQKDILALFTEKTFLHAIKKVFFSQPFRQNAIDEIFLRVCFVIGKL